MKCYSYKNNSNLRNQQQTQKLNRNLLALNFTVHFNQSGHGKTLSQGSHMLRSLFSEEEGVGGRGVRDF